MSIDGDAISPEEADDRTETAIAENEIVLFMKGTDLMPQCGYSERALALLQKHRDDVETVNTLDALEAYRDTLEERSGWRTIPQTFVDGEFVGGSDILEQHAERGDLDAKLDA